MRLLKLFLNPLRFIGLTNFYLGGDDSPDYVPIKPANVRSGFGTATANPETGQYSYKLNPQLAAMRDLFYGSAQNFRPTQQDTLFSKNISSQGINTFGRGQDFLSQALGINPQDTAQKYYNDVMALQAPDRAQEESRLADTLFKRGATGAAVGMEGGYVNPQQFALLKAREQANMNLGIQSQALGRQQQASDTNFAQGLMNTGVSQYGQGYAAGATPYNTMSGIFGLGLGIEDQGQKNTLGYAMQALNAQLAQQANAQAYENASADGGKGGIGGLIGGIAQSPLGQMGMNYLTGGGLSSLWSGTSPTSGLSSLFGGIGSGWGNANIGQAVGSWSPINTNIGMGGYSGPANFGGGTIGPTW